MRSALQVLSEHSSANATLKDEMRTKVENIIAAERKTLKKKNGEEESDLDGADDDENSGDDDNESSSSGDEDDSNVTSSDDEEDDDEVDDENLAKNMASDRLVPRSQGAIESMEEDAPGKAVRKRKQLDAFFETTKTATADGSSSMVTFHQFNLSRPVLKAIESQLGYATPTLVQSSCIPIIQSGRDVCASAQTGSGKTCAFLIPIVESLLQTRG